jgi:hypothetical protein
VEGLCSLHDTARRGQSVRRKIRNYGRNAWGMHGVRQRVHEGSNINTQLYICTICFPFLVQSLIADSWFLTLSKGLSSIILSVLLNNFLLYSAWSSAVIYILSWWSHANVTFSRLSVYLSQEVKYLFQARIWIVLLSFLQFSFYFVIPSSVYLACFEKYIYQI